jgi:hypothetical protein
MRDYHEQDERSTKQNRGRRSVTDKRAHRDKRDVGT